MSEDSRHDGPDTWQQEPADRLTRLAGAALAGLQGHPEFGEDVRGIITLKDASGGGSALWGYEEAGPEPVYDLIRASSQLFATLGISVELAGDPEHGREPYQVLPSPLPGDGPHETVRLTIIVNPRNDSLARVGNAVKDALENAGVSWGVTKLIILAQPEEGEAAILYHGLDGEHELAHQLLSAFRQVVAAGGGKVVLLPMGESPN
jgi:hypothetical protein